MMQQMLAAACAIGVGANFGTPIGGLLFSIEVTSTYYPLRNYYFSFVTSLAGSFVFICLWNIFRDQGTNPPSPRPTTIPPSSTSLCSWSSSCFFNEQAISTEPPSFLPVFIKSHLIFYFQQI